MIDLNVHGIDARLGYRFRKGLRGHLGYRLQLSRDESPVAPSAGSEIAPFDLDATQHTVTVGVTLTSAMLVNAL